MPRNLVALSALVMFACRAPIPATKLASAPVTPTPALAVETPAAAPEPMPDAVGSLDRPLALERFFAALARLEAGEATDDVRIVQLGDSHTAADWETGPVRRSLQARFGDGGRGFVPLGRPWKAWSQEGLLTGTAGAWHTQMNQPASRQATGDGVFGLTGFALTTRQSGARAWNHLLTASSSVEVAYLEQPGGGSFELAVNGARAARVSTRGEERRSAFRHVELTASLPHHVEVRAVGDGEVRIFGVAVDRTERGLVFDALGINGARVATPLSWNEAAWVEDLRHRAPALVIVAYGTNDAADPELSMDAFERGVTELLARVGRASTDAACLVLGPHDRASKVGTDWKTPARIVEVVARERRAAEAAGCAFFDRMKAMGGEGAMARWALDGRGGPDRVHLSRTGYAEVAGAFVTDLVGAFATWRTRRR